MQKFASNLIAALFVIAAQGSYAADSTMGAQPTVKFVDKAAGADGSNSPKYQSTLPMGVLSDKTIVFQANTQNNVPYNSTAWEKKNYSVWFVPGGGAVILNFMDYGYCTIILSYYSPSEAYFKGIKNGGNNPGYFSPLVYNNGQAYACQIFKPNTAAGKGTFVYNTETITKGSVVGVENLITDYISITPMKYGFKIYGKAQAGSTANMFVIDDFIYY